MSIFINYPAFSSDFIFYGFIALCIDLDSTWKLIFVAIVIFSGLSKSNDVL